MLIRYFWRDCNFRSKKWGAVPMDVFWLEATEDEARREVFPLLSKSAIFESEKLAEQPNGKADMCVNSSRSFCFLVARDLTSIDPLPQNYPAPHMWSGYSPFEIMPRMEVECLDQLKRIFSPPEIDSSDEFSDKTEENGSLAMGDMNLNTLLSQAELGSLPACASCPSSPHNAEGTAFGISCTEHGVDWKYGSRTISMMILSNPAGTTPAHTGRLCFVHNSENPSDKTAQNAFALWRAAVSLEFNEKKDEAKRYLKANYWTNAALHGTDEKKLNAARKCCTTVLKAQIDVLSPKIIIACGIDAANSLFEIGLFTKPWEEFKDIFNTGAYVERATLKDGSEVKVYCTLHTSGLAVNINASSLYSDLTEKLITEKRKFVDTQQAIDSFLCEYSADTTRGKGMRVLLLHWLDIGLQVRLAHEQG